MINNTGKTPNEIITGGYICMILMKDGTVYSCGRNYYGGLGDGTHNKSVQH